MTAWIYVSNGVIVCIGIAVEALNISWCYRVRLGEASQSRVVPAGVVEHETEAFGHSACGWVVHVGELSRVGVVRQPIRRRGGLSRRPGVS